MSRIECSKKALICGVGGQDGAYLARHRLSLGYQVIGASRDAQANRFESLERLGVREQVIVESMSLVDFRSTMHVVARMMVEARRGRVSPVRLQAA